MIELTNGAIYDIWLTTDTGKQIASLDEVTSLTYVKGLDLCGTFSLTQPDIYPDEFWAPDRLVQVWRRGPSQNRPTLDFLGFLRRWAYRVDAKGNHTAILAGFDQNCLLDRRIDAYFAGHMGAQFTNLALDDGMKHVVDANLGDKYDLTEGNYPDRDLTDAGLVVQVDLGQGATVDKGYAWRPVGRILRDLAAQSQIDTPEILYWIRVESIDPDGRVRLRFETGANFLGQDRSSSSPDPMIFGVELGNMTNTILEYDYFEAVNFVFVGGPGEGADRNIVTARDISAEFSSIWGRSEKFIDARNTDPAVLAGVANQALAQGAGRIRFEGEILDTPQAPYGAGWNLGDLITISHRGIEFNSVVRTIQVRVRAGEETIITKVKADIT